MPLFITSLNSGSNGNCYYIGNEEEAVLIDVGISCRETEKRMLRMGLSMSKVKAIFVSHEHGDHITGVPGLARKYQLPVYITEATFNHAGIPLEEGTRRSFVTDEPVTIGRLTVTPFSKYHDASDPYSFIVSGEGVTIGVFTDLGRPCNNLTRYFKQCHAAFLEANYDTDMLMKGNYPYHLKQRISGGNGHLSNHEALTVFLQHRSAGLSHLILSHLSKNNNHPELVQALFEKAAGNTHIVVASRYKETEVYSITTGVVPKRVIRKKSIVVKPTQLMLF